MPRFLAVCAACLLLLLAPTFASAQTIDIEHDGRTLELDIAGGAGAQQQAAIEHWARHIADSLTMVYGHWPRQRWRMAVYPIGSREAGEQGAGADVIPWAQVNRDRVDTASFYILAGASAEELIDNWTGYHELSHLLIPYRGWGDMWFSEGLASYYQNILRARSGVLSEREAWQRLYDGFSRGRADAVLNGRPLSEVSSSLRRNGAYMRVYWSGAWYFLHADLELRRASGGRNSLDTALAALNQCCADQQMSVLEMTRKMDQQNDTEVFERLYWQARKLERMPDFETDLASLGIDVGSGDVELNYSGAAARLRAGIMARP